MRNTEKMDLTCASLRLVVRELFASLGGGGQVGEGDIAFKVFSQASPTSLTIKLPAAFHFLTQAYFCKE